MSNNFEAKVKLITEVDYSSIEKVNPNEVAKRLAKAYGPVTKKLFRDPLLQLSKDYSKAGLKFNKNDLKSYSRDMQMEYAKSAVAFSDARAKLEKDSNNMMAKQQEILASRQMKSIEKQYKAKLSGEMELYKKRKAISDRLYGRGEEEVSSTTSTEESSSFKAADAFLRAQSEVYKSAAEMFDKTFDQVNEKAEEIEVKGLQASADKMDEAAGKFAGASKTMLGVVAGLGLAALAGFVKLISSAYDYALKFNKQILESSSHIDLGAANAKELVRNMGRVRAAAEDWGTALKYRTTTEENLQILKLLNQQAISYKTLAGDINDEAKAVENLRKVIEQTHQYSILLGLSLEEVTEKQAVMIKDLGYNVESANDAFLALARGAEVSGFNTKRFYSMVLQSTSGMAMYNMRVEEAAALLNTFGKALGTNADQFLQTLTKGFSEEGLTDRVKRVMTTGGKNMKDIFSRTSENMARKFFKDFKEQGDNLAIAFKESGLDLSGLNLGKSGGQKKIVQMLSKLDPKKQAELIAEVRKRSGDKTARALTKLVDVSRATTGNLGKMAKAMGQLDMSGKLVAQLKQANAVIGKPLHEMSLTQQMAFESITGISGESKLMLLKISEMLHGNYAVLQKELEFAKKSDLQGEALLAKQAELAKAYGATIEKTDQGWRLVAASVKEVVGPNGIRSLETVLSDAEIKSAEDIAASQEAALQKLVEQPMSKEIQIAEEIVKETRELKNVLKSGVQALLGNIYDTVNKILRLMPGSHLSVQEKENRDKALSDVAAKREGISKSEIGVRDSIAQLLHDMKTMSPEEKEAAKIQLDLLVQQKKAFKAEGERLDKLSEGIKNVTKSGSSTFLGYETGKDKTMEDFMKLGARGGDLSATQKMGDWLSDVQKETRLYGSDLTNSVKYMMDKMTEEDTIEKGVEATSEGVESLMSSVEEGGKMASGLAQSSMDMMSRYHDEDEKQSKDQHKDAMSVWDEMSSVLNDIRTHDAAKAVASLESLPSHLKAQAIDQLTKNKQLSPEIQALLSDEDQQRLSSFFGYGRPVDDFIVQGGGVGGSGKITRIDANDTVVGLKPSGPIDKALNNPAGGSGTNNNITINIENGNISTLLQALKMLGLTE